MFKNPFFKFISSLFVFSLFITSAHASAPSDFGNTFGLHVTPENRDQAVPINEGLQVVENFFYEDALKSDAEMSDQMMNQKDLLIAFEMMRSDFEGVELPLDDTQIYHEAWLRYRRMNLLPQPQVTYGTLQDFLYRYEVYKRHNDLPYDQGMVLDVAQISTDNYKSIPDVNYILDGLQTQIRNVRLEGTQENQDEVLPLLESYYHAFDKVKAELVEMEHPLNKIPDLPEETKQLIIDHDLNQVIAEIEYSYAHDAAYRQFNVVEAAMRFENNIYTPGEEISFTDGLGDLGGFQYGYVLKEGGAEEEWEYAGGICGPATLFFGLGYRAGLDVIERYPHSALYRNLYHEDALAMDAAIWFGGKDVKFKNNFDSDLLVYVVNDSANKVVKMYLLGNSPYTNVEIGPPVQTGTRSYERERVRTLADETQLKDILYTTYYRIY